MKWLLLVLLIATPVLVSPAVGDVYLGEPPQRAFTLVMSGTSFNGRSYPDTPLLEAFVGEAVQFTVVVPATAETHTFHLHGHPWSSPDSPIVPCVDAVSLSGPLAGATGNCASSVIDTVLLHPGDVHSFTVIAGGEGGEPGDWMYHCHFDEHMAAGMWGIFRVYNASVNATLLPIGALDVRVDRLGVPVDATFDAPAHAVRLETGHYLVHHAGDVLVAHTAYGDTVWRAGGAAATAKLVGAVAGHVHG